MAAGKRPGGLTALAVLNFVFGGFAVLGTLGILFFGSVASEVGESKVASILYVLALLYALIAGLLITSGVGYLQQKQGLGKIVGLTYAAISIATSLISIALAKRDVDLSVLIGFIYPVVTLILLLTVFKDDFPN